MRSLPVPPVALACDAQRDMAHLSAAQALIGTPGSPQALAPPPRRPRRWPSLAAAAVSRAP